MGGFNPTSDGIALKVEENLLDELPSGTCFNPTSDGIALKEVDVEVFKSPVTCFNPTSDGIALKAMRLGQKGRTLILSFNPTSDGIALKEGCDSAVPKELCFNPTSDGIALKEDSSRLTKYISLFQSDF